MQTERKHLHSEYVNPVVDPVVRYVLDGYRLHRHPVFVFLLLASLAAYATEMDICGW